jgi:hypothetical protein
MKLLVDIISPLTANRLPPPDYLDEIIDISTRLPLQTIRKRPRTLLTFTICIPHEIIPANYPEHAAGKRHTTRGGSSLPRSITVS